MTGALVFVTDYGLEDSYAAQLWAAAWAVDPRLRCVDGTHLVALGDVLTAAYRCKTLAQAFGTGAVVCAVVDPGVGGERGAIAVDCDGVLCVAPDTGLVTYLWSEGGHRQAVRLTIPTGASATFHGRDLFAPMAARLASGASLADLGEPLPNPRLRAELLPRAGDRAWLGHVVCVDHFGNAITAVRRRDLGARTVVSVEWETGRTARLVRTYADIGSGVAALWNSAEHLEIAACEASAAVASGLIVGMPVKVAWR